MSPTPTARATRAEAPVPAAIRSAAAEPFVAGAAETLLAGAERALDNGYGLLFVLDDDGRPLGVVTLGSMRMAIRDGRHLAPVTLGDLATPLADAPDECAAVRPALDAEGRLVDVETRPEAVGVPVAEPDLGRGELRAVLDAFLSTWISSSGDALRAFERRFAAYSEAAEGVAVSNGTVSLHLALAALGIGEGDEVILPDLTFAACANTVMHVGARPVLADVDPTTWCLSVETIAPLVTPRTRAIMVVHVFGRPAPMTEIMAFARARGLYVIEDCAEAHGARYDGRSVGSFGDVASFSFFANKIMTTGEGGICLTQDPEIAARMRMLRDHGMRPERRYWHEEAGFNFRMTNLQAAIGLAQLERIDDLLAMRADLFETYRAAFADVPAIEFPAPLPARHASVVWFCSVIGPAERRRAIIEACRAIGVDIRPFTYGLSTMPAYRRFARVCPVSASLALKGLNLPTTKRVDARLARRIAETIGAAIEG